MASIRLDVSRFEAQIAKLKRPGQPIARAINRSAASGKTIGAREVARDMRLKVGAVKEFIYVRQATPDRLTATIAASAKRVPVLDFNARGPEPSRGRGGGVRAGTPAGRYPRAFITTVGNGHRGVFERIGKARLPIRELFGASIWKSFSTVRPIVEARVAEQLAKNIASEINYALSRGR